jgi:hypothetical protein
VVKRFGSTTALAGVDLEVPEGCDDYTTADEAASGHREVAAGPATDLDATLSGLLDLQDDLADTVIWLAENWTSDLPVPQPHPRCRYLDNGECVPCLRLLVYCPTTSELLAIADLLAGPRGGGRRGEPIRQPLPAGDAHVWAGRYRGLHGTGGGVVSPIPFYDDGQVTLFCADFHAVGVETESVAAVGTSPPYNVGLDYHEGNDTLDWPRYWGLTTDADLMAAALMEHGRVWLNTAVAVREEPSSSSAPPEPGGEPGAEPITSTGSPPGVHRSATRALWPGQMA